VRLAGQQRLADFAVVEPVNLGAAVRFELALHPREALVDAVPARRDEVDEQGEIVHSRVAFGEEVVLQTLQAADRLSRETTHLCQLTADWSSLGTDTLADGILDPARQGRLKLGCELGEGLHLGARPLERRIHVTLCSAPFGGLLEPLPGPCHRCFVHGRER
jgi:hypothetical protein